MKENLEWISTTLNVFYVSLLTHTPYITAVEAGRSSRRDEGPGLDLGGVFLTKKDPPFFGGDFYPKMGCRVL